MNVKELIVELQKIKNKNLPVCKVNHETIQLSEYTSDSVCEPIEITIIEEKIGQTSYHFRGYDRVDRVELDGF